MSGDWIDRLEVNDDKGNFMYGFGGSGGVNMT